MTNNGVFSAERQMVEIWCFMLHITVMFVQATTIVFVKNLIAVTLSVHLDGLELWKLGMLLGDRKFNE